ncbi:LysR family transcriptional regulator [Poseidonocella sp. HB161398]|uniref:helix-turn-helix domain-containing protein n=1 Tax=Poseidonocella sp. HB161398 TaxID=2320855 RepID=UPI001109E77B|nr:LysR family transcriptional regulator [Poseidonocella sp. HB161398]
MSRPAQITPAAALEAVRAVAEHGGVSAAARAIGMTRAALQRRCRRAAAWGITAHGETHATRPRALAGQGLRRFLFTAAQSNAEVHPEVWRNLVALAEHYGARLMVGPLRYNHTEQHAAQEVGGGTVDRSEWYAPEVEPYLCADRVEVCPGLIWAGDMNIIPTAIDPLSGLDSFTGLASCVIAHPQIALKSIATPPGRPCKMNYTTGAVTLRRYIKRKAGLKAEFHHAFAALLVEVDSTGDWFARHVNASSDGMLCDLDIVVEGGEVTTGNRVEVLTPGDLHGTKADPVAVAAVWGAGGLADTLRPVAQVLHDVLNFGSRSHHNSVTELLALHRDKADSVEGEIGQTAELLHGIARRDCITYVAKANHDEHLDRWIRDTDWRRDPPNAAFYLATASAWAEAIARGEDFDPAAWALRRAGLPRNIRFLSRADVLELAGIRHDMHGDIGPNGARGSARNLARLGERVNVGHSHSAAIVQGAYQAGTLSVLDMGYNRGPSSWSHSLILTYRNGKRAIITLRGQKWRAVA